MQTEQLFLFGGGDGGGLLFISDFRHDYWSDLGDSHGLNFIEDLLFHIPSSLDSFLVIHSLYNFWIELPGSSCISA